MFVDPSLTSRLLRIATHIIFKTMDKSTSLRILMGTLLSIDMGVLAQDAHGAIDPSIDFSGTVDSALLDVLSPTESHWDQWDGGWIPQDCKSIAEDNGVSPGDMEVFNVYYTDCDQAWVMCRHKDARKSLVDMIDVSLCLVLVLV